MLQEEKNNVKVVSWQHCRINFIKHWNENEKNRQMKEACYRQVQEACNEQLQESWAQSKDATIDLSLGYIFFEWSCWQHKID